MLHWDQVKRQMHEITELPIENRAIMELITYVEPMMEKIIKQSVIEHEKLNKMYKIQGLKPKRRLDQDSVRNAIKTINSNEDSELSERTGGISSKEGEKNVLHRKKETEAQGVETQ
jgi:hypothetical protein